MTKRTRHLHSHLHRLVAAAHVRGLDLASIAAVIFFQIGN